jgi:GT2 family glycosyltransferase
LRRCAPCCDATPTEAWYVSADRSPDHAAVTASAERLEGLERQKRQLPSRSAREHDLARTEHEELVRARSELEQRDRDVAATQHAVVRREQALQQLRERIGSLEADLALAQLSVRRMAESVTWQVFQKVRARVYRLIGGERSLLARALGASLRFAGRLITASKSDGTRSAPAPSHPSAAGVIEIPEHDDPCVSLIMSLHTHAELTRACLHSIVDHTTHANYEVILVDDTADLETQQLLGSVRGARILRNDRNLGYLRSMNRGASIARGEWLVLFNNDTEVTQGWLAAMLSCATSAPDVGIVTPKFLFPDGTVNEAGGIVWRDGSAMNYGRGDAPHHFQYSYRRETDYGSAAALMVTAELWRDVGGFDERYVRGYYEDTDLCFEARERGWRVLYEPEAVIVHVEGATHGTDPGSGEKRYQEENRQRFAEKWRSRLEAEQQPPSPSNPRLAADRHRGSRMLVVDHRVPMPDRDSGSLRMLGIIRALVALGVHVTFLPESGGAIQPYTRRLQRMGVQVLYGQIDVGKELAVLGPSLHAALLCRPHAASRWLDTVREVAPSATVLYDSVDLHWLREARRQASRQRVTPVLDSNARIELDALSPKAKALRELELALIRATDVTVAVSEDERIQIERDVPGANVLVIPNVHTTASYVLPYQDRSGILFVGGFEHPPNVDAALSLAREVMPAVWEKLGQVKLTIVGADAPLEVQALASDLIDVTGWVPDLQPILERSRIMMAPLSYGAGLKGKVTQALAAGLPVVTTSIGAEGVERPCLLVADDAGALAREAIRLYRDEDLWQQLSDIGQRFIAEHCSIDLVSRRLGEFLGLAARPMVATEIAHVL